MNERLKILLETLDIKPAQAARVLGISASTMNNYLDRGSKPGYEVLEKLYLSFENLNLDWLFGGGGEPLLNRAAGANSAVSNNKKITRSLVVGHVGGNATQNQGASTNEAAMERELELLRSQIVAQERTIKAQERTIELLDRRDNS